MVERSSRPTPARIPAERVEPPRKVFVGEGVSLVRRSSTTSVIVGPRAVPDRGGGRAECGLGTEQKPGPLPGRREQGRQADPQVVEPRPALVRLGPGRPERRLSVGDRSPVRGSQRAADRPALESPPAPAQPLRPRRRALPESEPGARPGLRAQARPARGREDDLVRRQRLVGPRLPGRLPGHRESPLPQRRADRAALHQRLGLGHHARPSRGHLVEHQPQLLRG